MMRIAAVLALLIGSAAAAPLRVDVPPAGPVTIVAIKDEIDLGLAPFIDRIAAEARPGDLLVLDINTLGGRIDAALVIRDALLHTKARTVCWVDPRAISAGALISLACDLIAVAPGATIGAATPVQLGAGGEMKPVEEKVVSYMRGEMRATAVAKGRRGEIAEAMVDRDVVVTGLTDKGKLLTLDGTQALATGVADFEAADEAALWRALGRESPATISRPTISWAEDVARFLSNPIVSGLLMTLGLLGILIELWAPGHGISLVAGLCCLGVYFFGHHVAQLAGWEAIVMFVAGAALVAYEVLVPGHIVPGVLGALLVVAALVLAMVDIDHLPLGIAWNSGVLPKALGVVLGSVAATALAGALVVRLLPNTRVGRALVLDTQLPSLGRAHHDETGLIGETATDLVPSGTVIVDGRRREATIESGWLPAGTKVRVVAVDGIRLVVKRDGES